MSKVIITGGRGVLGLAVARAFSRASHDVALIARSSTPSDCARICIDGGDLSDAAVSEAAFGRASTALGRADVLVNVAGSFTFEQVDGAPARGR
jgi:3-oxoacyl-[acyl-carrier protein] reductase